MERTPDGRWIVVDGAVRTARAGGDEDAVRRARTRVHAAKTGLGERGTPWWDQDTPSRAHRWTEALRTLAEE